MTYQTTGPFSEAGSLHVSIVYEAVTPSDSTDLTTLARAIYVGGAGNVVAVQHDGPAGKFTGVPAGTVLPIAVRRI
ncbi:MAG: spike base protein, RCAP_Rcc01079 family, partial [Ilumatobacteraceae bacterium]